GVMGVRGIPPGTVRVLLLGGDRGAHGQLQGLPDRPRPLAVRPEVALIHGAVGFGQPEHGEPVVIHAATDGITEDAGLVILGGDDAAERLADVIAVRAEVWILAGGDEDQHGHAGDAGPLHYSLPVDSV